MSSTSLRLFLVVLCIAGLSAAQSFTSCPSPTSSSTDYFAPSNCSAFTTCATTRCSCIGGTFNSTTGACAVNTTGKTCATSKACQAPYIQCIQAAASSVACLSPLKVALVAIVAGSAYNASAVYTACQSDTCRFYNATSASNCTIGYGEVCFLPPTTAAPGNSSNTTVAPAVGTTAALFTGSITLGGDYTAIIANATSTATFLVAVGNDMTAKFTVTVTCRSLKAGSGIVAFTANVAANNATFLAAVSAVGTDSSWLTQTKASFTALGGTGTFGLTGITSDTTPAPTVAPKGTSAMVLAWSVLVALLVSLLA